jgi:hypothetical protein
MSYSIDLPGRSTKWHEPETGFVRAASCDFVDRSCPSESKHETKSGHRLDVPGQACGAHWCIMSVLQMTLVDVSSDIIS